MKFKTEYSMQSKEANPGVQYSQKSFGIEPNSNVQSQINLQTQQNNQITAVVSKVNKTCLTIENSEGKAAKKKK